MDLRSQMQKLLVCLRYLCVNGSGTPKSTNVVFRKHSKSVDLQDPVNDRLDKKLAVEKKSPYLSSKVSPPLLPLLKIGRCSLVLGPPRNLPGRAKNIGLAPQSYRG